MLCDVEGVAQASGASVAAHKARRFDGDRRIVDLCCGIGGDTMALADAGEDVTGVDRCLTRTRMAGHNAGARMECADVAGYGVDGALVHIDPGRRSSGRRLWRYQDLQPGADVIEPLLSAADGAALKLGPGVDWDEVPDRPQRECEVI